MKTKEEILDVYVPADRRGNGVSEAVCYAAMRDHATEAVEAALKKEWVPISEGWPKEDHWEGMYAVSTDDGKIVYGCDFVSAFEELSYPPRFYKVDFEIEGPTHYLLLDLTPPNI